MKIADTFQERFRECRTTARRSIESVSAESGYSTAYLRRLERGKMASPTILAVWCIAEALEVRPGYLLGIEDAK